MTERLDAVSALIDDGVGLHDIELAALTPWMLAEIRRLRAFVEPLCEVSYEERVGSDGVHRYSECDSCGSDEGRPHRTGCLIVQASEALIEDEILWTMKEGV